MTARTFSAVPRPSRRLLFPETPPLRAGARSHGAVALPQTQGSWLSQDSSSDSLSAWGAALLRLRSGTDAPTSRATLERTAQALSPGRLWAHPRGIAAQHQV